MELKTVFTKTAKGVTQVNQKTQSLSRDLMKVLKLVDGKSTLEELAERNDIAAATLDKAMNQLKKEAFIKVFEVKVETPLSDFGGDGGDDFDFTKPSKPAGPANLMPSFGPSKFRSPLAFDQVDHAVKPAAPAAPAVDEAKLQAERAAAAAAQQKAREEALRAQALARARAEREAELRARLEVEARARKEAEARAQEEAVRAEEAARRSRAALEAKLEEERKQKAALSDTRNRLSREQIKIEEEQRLALIAARTKAEAEATAFAAARAKAEEAVKSLTAARAEADAAAKRQQEEFAVAQRDLRAQLKAEIEAKVRAEMEQLLKADIEEDAREEVEAAVRQEAQEEARRLLEEQLTTERESLARAEASAKERAEVDVKRMLAEQEAKMRAEMELQVAALTAEKNKAEEAARRMVEEQAEQSAKAAEELAARLKAEEDARRIAEAEAFRVKRAEAEAAAAAKKAAAAAAEMEVRLKAEEEARHAVEREAEQRKKVEAESRVRLEARAREEAEQRAKLEAEMHARLAAEKEAKLQAEARALIEQEMRENAERASSAKLVGAERARELAEKKAAMEASAREIAMRGAAEQAEERKRVERESEIALRRERDLREKAEEKARLEEEAEARARAAQVARLKELQEDAADAAEARALEVKPKKRRLSGGGGGTLKWLLLAGFAAIGLALGVVQFLPLGGTGGRLVAAVAGWFHEDVSASSVRVGLMPRPHVKLEQVNFGKSLDAQAASGKLFMNLGGLFGEKFEVNTLELSNVKVSANALTRASKWADVEGRGKSMKLRRLQLRDVTTEIRGLDIGIFDADIDYDAAGKMTRVAATTKSGRWTLIVTPDKSADGADANPPWLVEFVARNLAMPMGVPLNVLEVKAQGSIVGQELTMPMIEGRMLGGSVGGKLRADWKQHPTFQADLTATNVTLDELTTAFTRDLALSGRMTGNFTISSTAPNVGQLLDRPQIRGNFDVKDGAVSNVDLVQAMRSPDTAGRGGQTKFSELTGQLRVGEGMVRFEQVKLAGGVLLANGNISANMGSGNLAGNVGAEIRSTVAQDRGSFSLSGTVARPILKRGN